MTDIPEDQSIQRDKMAHLGHLTANIAHEINNPVNYISLSAASLRKDLDDIIFVLSKYSEITPICDLKKKLGEIEDAKKEVDWERVLEEVSQLVDSISEGANHIALLVKELRGFAHPDYNAVSAVNLNERINMVLMILNSQYKLRINVHKDFSELPLVEAIPGKLDQVFMNLLMNAIQSIKDKGNIYISTKLSENSSHVVVSIRDTGEGIEDAIRERIFDPFFTTKSAEEGTGLGLSITKGIIHDHKGTIECKSQVGKGTEFIVCLPVKYHPS